MLIRAKNRGLDPDLTTHILALNSDSWHRSLKAVALLYRWQLIPQDGDLIRLLQMCQDWFNQPRYRSDDHLFQQLVHNWPRSDRQPHIWACLHIGPYGMLPRMLMRQGHKLAILLRSAVFEAQAAIYRQQFRCTFGREATAAELIFVKADQGNPLRRLREALQQGFHVIFFVDGQLDIGQSAKGWIPVRLHGVELSLRAGIAALSCWSGVPITAAILTCRQEQMSLYLGEDRTVHNKADYQPILQSVVDLVQELEPEELIQWECLPRLFDSGAADGPNKLPRRSIWLPLVVGEKEMLFDLATGRSVVIGAQEFERACRQFQLLRLYV
ncbi:hypothetical protein [Sphingobacterium multivorum]|uniref:hypothetical protein n=1 Tax=Sphingobacterium multivorum TaxID=28454 RepID=UPI0031BAF9DE